MKQTTNKRLINIHIVFCTLCVILCTLGACKSVHNFEIPTSDKVIKIILKNPAIEDLGIGICSVSLNIIEPNFTREQMDSIDIEYNNSNVNIFNAYFKNKEEFPFLEIFTDEEIFLVSEKELQYLEFCKNISKNKGKDYILKCIDAIENSRDTNNSNIDEPLKWYLLGEYKISPECLRLIKTIP